MKSKDVSTDSCLFWKTAKDFISHHLPDIRNVSENTVSAYREGLNKYIDYLESEKWVKRKDISFSNFSRDELKEYLNWMLNNKKYAKKTCNLRITSIHSLLEYAAYEYSTDLMSVYQEACTVKCVKVENHPIEYFESKQMKALLLAPDTSKRIGRRNQMILILYYDTAARISELINATFDQIHLDSDIPYITILGKGHKYRNIPLMNKTVSHLNHYFKEFHPEGIRECPLFYTTTYGQKHHLSSDTIEKMIRKYADICISKGIEMPEKSHCHLIRKTRAMDLYKTGVPLAHIQQLLGHKNISTTTGFYAFATLDTLANALNIANKPSADEAKRWDDKDVLKKIYRL